VQTTPVLIQDVFLCLLCLQGWVLPWAMPFQESKR
jgi:hypothetical protein